MGRSFKPTWHYKNKGGQPYDSFISSRSMLTKRRVFTSDLVKIWALIAKTCLGGSHTDRVTRGWVTMFVLGVQRGRFSPTVNTFTRVTLHTILTCETFAIYYNHLHAALAVICATSPSYTAYLTYILIIISYLCVNKYPILYSLIQHIHISSHSK